MTYDYTDGDGRGASGLCAVTRIELQELRKRRADPARRPELDAARVVDMCWCWDHLGQSTKRGGPFTHFLLVIRVEARRSVANMHSSCVHAHERF